MSWSWAVLGSRLLGAVWGCQSGLNGWVGIGNEMFFLSGETLKECLCGCESLVPWGLPVCGARLALPLAFT